ncbi:ketoacyl-ACP synthase III [Alphaproteobacteria bacterium]|nr:ketoacyl-ACP synthase III [Alphaproteobacteria bacterium]
MSSLEKSNFPGSIIDIAYYLPDRTLRNSELVDEFPDWNVNATADKVGVFERRISGGNETALDLALKACDKLFLQNPKFKSKIDAVLFCTQTPDYIMPSNAFLVHDKLGLSDNVIAFDYNLACSGYVYGLVLASSLMKTGVAKNILLLTGDTYSKIIDKRDRSTRMLFGDGAAATWLSSETFNDKKPIIKKMVDFRFGTRGSGWDKFIVESGAHRTMKKNSTKVPSNDKIFMNGMQVLNFVKRIVVPHMSQFLLDNKLQNHEINQFIIHQASKLALDVIKQKINIDDDKCFSNLDKMGNTVSSSIPILLKDYFEKVSPKKGEKLIVTTFGVGYSWGSLIAET